MDPPSSYRRLKLAPHQTTTPLTPTEDLFVICHLGVPRVDPARWSLRRPQLPSGIARGQARLELATRATRSTGCRSRSS